MQLGAQNKVTESITPELWLSKEHCVIVPVMLSVSVESAR